MRRLGSLAERVDWFQVLEDLRRAGLPCSAVAKHLRVPHSTVHGWKMGVEPKHVDGELLVDLWIGITQCNRHQVPRVGK